MARSIVALLLFLFSLSALAQDNGESGLLIASGGAGVTFVNGGINASGGGSVSATSLVAGNHLVIWTYSNDVVTTHTCTAPGNTVVADAVTTAAGGSVIGNLAHIKSIASSGSLTITCTGTTPGVAWVQYSGGSGDFDTTSSGTNGSSAIGTPSVSPAAFTPTNANDILVNGYADTTGSTITLTETDTNYTIAGSQLNGSTEFVGAVGYRVVTSTASYTDGWTSTSFGLGINGAYK